MKTYMGTRLVMVSVAGLLATGCLSSKPVTAAQLGAVEVASPRLGKLTAKPTECLSGARQYFLGGDLADENAGVVVRLVVDPLYGPAIRVFAADAPFEKSVTFRRDECAVFHFSIDSTGWRVDRVDDYRLTLNVECERSGESVRGSASATHCH